MWRARGRHRRVDALVGVHDRVGDGAVPLGVVEHATEEMQGKLRETEFPVRIVEQVGLSVRIPHRYMCMAPVACQAEEGLRHEGGAERTRDPAIRCRPGCRRPARRAGPRSFERREA